MRSHFMVNSIQSLEVSILILSIFLLGHIFLVIPYPLMHLLKSSLSHVFGHHLVFIESFMGSSLDIIMVHPFVTCFLISSLIVSIISFFTVQMVLQLFLINLLLVEVLLLKVVGDETCIYHFSPFHYLLSFPRFFLADLQV